MKSTIVSWHDASYNLPYFWKLTGEVDVEKLYSALINSFNNHDIYDSYLSEGEFITDKSTVFRPAICELSYFNSREFELAVVEKVKSYAYWSFDINTWPLQEAIIFVNTKKNSNEYFLFINVSHLICDVSSAYELITEINNGKIEKLNITISNPNNTISPKREQRAKDYFASWLKLIDSLEQPNFQLDKSLTRKNADITINKKLIDKITLLSNNTEFEVLLTSYIVLLSRLTSQKIVTVGVPLENRRKYKRHSHGCFVNNLPITV